MAIASLGGATVKDDGTRDYPGSGGYVGGLSFPGGNWSVFGGAGSVYNKFTPTINSLTTDVPISDTGGGDTGGGVITGGSSSGGGGTSGGSSSVGGLSGGASYTVFNTPSSPYRGSGAISAGGNSLIASLNSLLQALQLGQINSATAITQASLEAQYLNNPNVFYQARHGNDASILQQLRNQASSILAAISSYTAPAPTTVPTDGSNQPVVGRDRAGAAGGGAVDNTSLLALLQGLLQPTQPQQIEAPPNLFQSAPTGGNTSTGVNMKNIAILAVVAIAAYYLYKKYA